MTKTTQYKNTTIGSIPIDWEVKKLGEVVDKIAGGGTPSRLNEEYWDGDIFWATVKDLNSNKLISTIEKISDLGLSNSSATLVKKGNLIIATRMALGKIVKNEIDVAINQDLKALYFKNNVINEFGYYWYESNNEKINDFGTGSTVKGISLIDLRNLTFPLPPLLEQQKIAEILSTWDKAIQETDAIIKKLEDRNKALAFSLLTGKKRIEGFEGDWKSLKIKDVFKEVRDVNDGEELHTALTISAKKGFVSQEDKFDRVIAGQSLKKYTLLKKGDYAYNKGNSKTYKYGCIYTLDDYESALVPFVYICFRPLINICNDFYSHWFLNHNLDNQLKKIITSGARGDGLLNVSRNDFFNLFLEVPSIKEQNAIAEILNTANQEVTQYQQKLETLKLQKKGLMQQLLTGKTRTV